MIPDPEFDGGSEEPDICRNYHGGNAESEGANLDTATRKAQDRSRIASYLQLVGGRTCDEIERALSLAHQTASARCSEMLKDGVIRRAPDGKGKYKRRPTRRGSMAAVLIVPPGVAVELDCSLLAPVPSPETEADKEECQGNGDPADDSVEEDGQEQL